MDHNVLWTFMSPQTGRILCDTDHVLVGDANGVAIPSLYIPGGALPNLTDKHLWIGDASNRPVETLIITIDNLPNLGTSIILPSPLPRGKIWRGTSSNRPEESDALSELEILVLGLQIDIIDLQGKVAQLRIDVIALTTGLASLTSVVTALSVTVSEVKTIAKYGPKPYINIFLTNNAIPTPVAASTWTKILGTTALSSAHAFIVPIANQIKYTDPDTQAINTLVTLNVTVENDLGADCVIGIAVFRNSIQVAPVSYMFQAATASKVSIALTNYVQFTNNTDYIEAYVICDNACNILCSEMSFSVATT